MLCFRQVQKLPVRLFPCNIESGRRGGTVARVPTLNLVWQGPPRCKSGYLKTAERERVVSGRACSAVRVMREALVKAAVFWLQVLSGLKWAAGRAGSKIGPRCGPRYGAVSFCGNKNGLQKGAVGGLRQRVGARSLNALACGKPRKLSGAGPTVSLDSSCRSAESCIWQGPGCVAAIGQPLRGPRFRAACGASGAV